MGRQSYSHRATVEQKSSIPISCLRKKGILNPGSYSLSWKRNGRSSGNVLLVVSADQSLQVIYKWRNSGDTDWISAKHTVHLTSTPVHFGGKRSWCRCTDCNRRVAIIYVAGSQVSCRHCMDIRYTSQREQPIDRIIRRKDKLESKLGFNLHNGLIQLKPKGMHWKTFDQILQKARAADAEIISHFKERVGLS